MPTQSPDDSLRQTNEPQQRHSMAKYAWRWILISLVTLFFIWADWGFHLRWLKHAAPVGPLPANATIEAAPANTVPVTPTIQTSKIGT